MENTDIASLSSDEQCIVARDSKAPSWQLVQLAQNDNPSIRGMVATNPSMPADVLLQLSQDRTSYVREGAAKNVKLPSYKLAELITDKHKNVREAAARNPNCSLEALSSIAFNPFSDVRYYAAGNPSCPDEALEYMAKSPMKHLRAAVAANLTCSVKLLERLANDPHNFVRANVAGNSNCPYDVLLFLVKNGEADSVLKNPTCRGELLEIIATYSKHPEDVVTHPNCPATLLAEIASMYCDYEFLSVCKNIISHPNCPEYVLIEFLKEGLHELNQQIYENPILQPSTVEAMYKKEVAEDRLSLETATGAIVKKILDPTEVVALLAWSGNKTLAVAVCENYPVKCGSLLDRQLEKYGVVAKIRPDIKDASVEFLH